MLKIRQVSTRPGLHDLGRRVHLSQRAGHERPEVLRQAAVLVDRLVERQIARRGPVGAGAGDGGRTHAGSAAGSGFVSPVSVPSGTTRNCSSVRVFGPKPGAGGIGSLLFSGWKSASGVPPGNGTGASLCRIKQLVPASHLREVDDEIGPLAGRQHQRHRLAALLKGTPFGTTRPVEEPALGADQRASRARVLSSSARRWPGTSCRARRRAAG